MRYHLRIRNLPDHAGLIAYVQRRARFALTRFAPVVAAVSASVGGQTGPRSEIDKLCRVTVRLHDGPSITVSCFDSDVRSAIDRAFARVERTVTRSMQRRANRRTSTEVGTSGQDVANTRSLSRNDLRRSA